ncbi:hypothetical protein RB2501_05805 [Robiginitalea biformata HTCC2501]|uniref:Uncharacterized protein n=1 Tax=Robiginitalea biformata (strain ATCC BAA-864 / DSM 15991 / KCTC 12146 / HTCC2501) TaxID=313596 RepID=A4CHI1_ROBBH|nr:hypothetical protein RB2501_05805 [Robiginitalea biformata HTCC2501]
MDKDILFNLKSGSGKFPYNHYWNLRIPITFAPQKIEHYEL